MQSAPMYDESLLQRYRGIVELASRGEGGEKENAQRLVERMQKKHPHIHLVAYPPAPPEEEFEGPPFPEGAGDYSPFGETFGQFFSSFASRMRNGASWAAQAAYEAMQIETARQAAVDTVEIRSKILASGKWQVAAKIELDQLDIFAEDFTPVQAEMFADEVSNMVRDKVLEAMGYEIE